MSERLSPFKAPDGSNRNLKYAGAFLGALAIGVGTALYDATPSPEMEPQKKEASADPGREKAGTMPEYEKKVDALAVYLSPGGEGNFARQVLYAFIDSTRATVDGESGSQYIHPHDELDGFIAQALQRSIAHGGGPEHFRSVMDFFVHQNIAPSDSADQSELQRVQNNFLSKISSQSDMWSLRGKVLAGHDGDAMTLRELTADLNFLNIQTGLANLGVVLRSIDNDVLDHAGNVFSMMRAEGYTGNFSLMHIHPKFLRTMENSRERTAFLQLEQKFSSVGAVFGGAHGNKTITWDQLNKALGGKRFVTELASGSIGSALPSEQLDAYNRIYNRAHLNSTPPGLDFLR